MLSQEDYLHGMHPALTDIKITSEDNSINLQSKKDNNTHLYGAQQIMKDPQNYLMFNEQDTLGEQGADFLKISNTIKLPYSLKQSNPNPELEHHQSILQQMDTTNCYRLIEQKNTQNNRSLFISTQQQQQEIQKSDTPEPKKCSYTSISHYNDDHQQEKVVLLAGGILIDENFILNDFIEDFFLHSNFSSYMECNLYRALEIQGKNAKEGLKVIEIPVKRRSGCHDFQAVISKLRSGSSYAQDIAVKLGMYQQFLEQKKGLIKMENSNNPHLKSSITFSQTRNFENPQQGSFQNNSEISQAKYNLKEEHMGRQQQQSSASQEVLTECQSVIKTVGKGSSTSNEQKNSIFAQSAKGENERRDQTDLESREMINDFILKHESKYFSYTIQWKNVQEPWHSQSSPSASATSSPMQAESIQENKTRMLIGHSHEFWTLMSQMGQDSTQLTSKILRVKKFCIFETKLNRTDYRNYLFTRIENEMNPQKTDTFPSGACISSLDSFLQPLPLPILASSFSSSGSEGNMQKGLDTPKQSGCPFLQIKSDQSKSKKTNYRQIEIITMDQYIFPINITLIEEETSDFRLSFFQYEIDKEHLKNLEESRAKLSSIKLTHSNAEDVHREEFSINFARKGGKKCSLKLPKTSSLCEGKERDLQITNKNGGGEKIRNSLVASSSSSSSAHGGNLLTHALHDNRDSLHPNIMQYESISEQFIQKFYPPKSNLLKAKSTTVNTVSKENSKVSNHPVKRSSKMVPKNTHNTTAVHELEKEKYLEEQFKLFNPQIEDNFPPHEDPSAQIIPCHLTKHFYPPHTSYKDSLGQVQNSQKSMNSQRIDLPINLPLHPNGQQSQFNSYDTTLSQHQASINSQNPIPLPRPQNYFQQLPFEETLRKPHPQNTFSHFHPNIKTQIEENTQKDALPNIPKEQKQRKRKSIKKDLDVATNKKKVKKEAESCKQEGENPSYNGAKQSDSTDSPQIPSEIQTSAIQTIPTISNNVQLQQEKPFLGNSALLHPQQELQIQNQISSSQYTPYPLLTEQSLYQQPFAFQQIHSPQLQPQQQLFNPQFQHLAQYFPSGSQTYSNSPLLSSKPVNSCFISLNGGMYPNQYGTSTFSPQLTFSPYPYGYSMMNQKQSNFSPSPNLMDVTKCAPVCPPPLDLNAQNQPQLLQFQVPMQKSKLNNNPTPIISESLPEEEVENQNENNDKPLKKQRKQRTKKIKSVQGEKQEDADRKIIENTNLSLELKPKIKDKDDQENISNSQPLNYLKISLSKGKKGSDTLTLHNEALPYSQAESKDSSILNTMNRQFQGETPLQNDIYPKENQVLQPNLFYSPMAQQQQFQMQQLQYHSQQQLQLQHHFQQQQFNQMQQLPQNFYLPLQQPHQMSQIQNQQQQQQQQQPDQTIQQSHQFVIPNTNQMSFKVPEPFLNHNYKQEKILNFQGQQIKEQNGEIGNCNEFS